MAEKSTSNKLGDVIAVIIGAPITLFVLLLWSPYILLAAIFNLFSSDKLQQPSTANSSQGVSTSANCSSAAKPLSKGSFLLIAASLFAAFIGLLSFKSGGGVNGSSFRGASYSTPARSGSRIGGEASSSISSGSAIRSEPVWVNGYYRQNGTYVQPHFRTAPDGNPSNNWSTYPNVNPYTGKTGTHSSYAHGGHGRGSGRR